jgi:hypothetical protein
MSSDNDYRLRLDSALEKLRLVAAERDRLRDAIMDGVPTGWDHADPVDMLAEERKVTRYEIAACNDLIDTLTSERDELARQLAVLADQCGPSCAKEIEDLRCDRDEARAVLKHVQTALARNHLGADIEDEIASAIAKCKGDTNADI